MITLIIRFTAKEGGEQAFAAAARRVVENTRANDDCIEFTVLQDKENPREFVLFERWKDEASLAAHAARLKVLREAGGETAAEVPSLGSFAERTVRGSYEVIA